MVCCHTSSCLQSNNSQVCWFSFCPNHSDTDKLKDRALGEVIHLFHRDFWPHVLYESQHDTRPTVRCWNSSAQSIARSTNQTGELRIHQKYTGIHITSALVNSRAQHSGQEVGTTTSLHLQSLQALQDCWGVTLNPIEIPGA